MKEKLKLDKLKEFLGKYSKKTKIIAAVVTVGVIAAAIIIAAVLNHKNFAVLFSEVSQEEATKIVGKLQEAGVEYQYQDNGDILVPEEQVDQTRANLAFEGYPESGFTYNMFTEHAGGMTTDTEKQTYKLYELQDRIGATIKLFDGVKDAKVNIALGENQKYVLQDSEESKSTPSASVVVTMENGGSPSEKQALGIQRLVAKSVPDMEMDNVSVIDGSGIEVSTGNNSGNSTSGDAGEEIAQLIEVQISKKVINVLEPFFGANNIRVSAKGKVNMEKVVRESTTYNTPEKKDENDKTGIVSSETTSKDEATGGTGTGGVAGTETNADTPQYNAGTTDGASTSLSESQTRDYLVNQIKEQGEIDPGVLQDLTVSVAINSNDLGDLNQNQLRDLVGNATGIGADDRRDKITIVNAPFYEEKPAAKEAAATLADKMKESWPLLLAAGIVAFIILIVLVIVLSRKRKNKGEEEELEEFIVPVEAPEEEGQKPEILNLRNERSRELRESVRDFADENPEISAQMIKSWLNGGNQDGRN